LEKETYSKQEVIALLRKVEKKLQKKSEPFHDLGMYKAVTLGSIYGVFKKVIGNIKGKKINFEETL